MQWHRRCAVPPRTKQQQKQHHHRRRRSPHQQQPYASMRYRLHCHRCIGLTVIIILLHTRIEGKADRDRSVFYNTKLRAVCTWWKVMRFLLQILSCYDFVWFLPWNVCSANHRIGCRILAYMWKICGRTKNMLSSCFMYISHAHLCSIIYVFALCATTTQPPHSYYAKPQSDRATLLLLRNNS